MNRRSKPVTISNHYVAYYRLSRPKFDEHGNVIPDPLGIDSQRNIVRRFVEDKQGTLIAEYSEIKSGSAKNRLKRTEIHRAITLAKETKATLIFAYVDRFARDVEFSAYLQNSGVKFVCCDAPYANEFTINVMASMAQEYSRSISEKTKRGLEEKKKKGEPLGCLTHKKPGCKIPPSGLERSIEVRKEKAKRNPNNVTGQNRVFSLFLDEYTVDQILFVCQLEGIKSPKGKPVRKETIRRWLKPMLKKRNTENYKEMFEKQKSQVK